MNKPLNPRAHGYIDYAVVLTLLLIPTALGFSQTPAVICYVLAAVHLTMTLITAFPLGVVGVIPFPVHGAIEAVMAVALVAMPWLAGFEQEAAARNFFMISAGALALTWMLTDYKAAQAAPIRGRRTPSFG